jgi:hypothetical protein
MAGSAAWRRLESRENGRPTATADSTGENFVSHTHEHSDSNYYLEQLCLIAIGAALGGGGVYLWATSSLDNLLVSLFQVMTLIGGLCLLGIVVVRGLSLWESVKSRGSVAEHNHDRDHNH